MTKLEDFIQIGICAALAALMLYPVLGVTYLLIKAA
jgi:hypothetical protein